MNRKIIGSSMLALVLLGAASTVASHHPPRFERCKLLTVSGELVRVEWSNPHVLLYIRTESGASEEVGWLSLQGLARAGIRADALHEGDRLVVQGGFRPKDIAAEPILLSSIHRPSDGWRWSRPPQGC